MSKKRIIVTKVQGSLTVETALVLPIFIYTIIAFMYFIQIIGLQEYLQNAITQTGFYAAKYAYVYDYIHNYEETGTSNKNVGLTESDDLKGNEELTSVQGESVQNSIKTSLDALIAHTIDSAFYKFKMQEYIDVSTINHSCIKNGFSGIHTYLSSYMVKDDAVDIILIYKIKLPLLFINLKDIQIIQRVRLRGWSGHKVALKNSKAETPEEGEASVYITETGTVYHLSKECTHLLLSIKAVTMEQIEGLRNNSGGKYKECILCKNSRVSTEGKCVYITNTGDRYHWSLACSGLKRTIITISLSEVGNRSLCKRCGK